MVKLMLQFSTAIYDVSLPCNYRCIYCRNNWDNHINNTHIDLKQIKRNIAIFNECKFSRIIFTGGEFFIIPYWKEILTYSKKLGFEIWIITNGYCISMVDISFIRNHVTKINFSFHAHNSKLYNSIMVPPTRDAFNIVLKNMKAVSDNGINIGVFFSPLKENIDFFYETIKKITDFGINITDVNLNRIIPAHLNKYFKENPFLNIFEHKNLVLQSVRIYNDLNVKVALEGYPYCFLKEIVEDDELIDALIQPCLLGRKALAFNFDGTIKLCPATHFSIGSINELQKIHRNLDIFLKNNWRNEKCRYCINWEICLGGCHASRGKLFSDDYLLVYDKIYFIDGIESQFFDMLVALYRPFLSTSYRKAYIQYTVLSKKYKYPIGIIALNKTKSAGKFLQIALIPDVIGKFYSFQILNLFFKKHNFKKIGWTAHKANLPSIKLLQKLRGGFFKKTVIDKRRIEAEGFFRPNGTVSKSMQEALEKLLKESQQKYNDWLREYNTRIQELNNLKEYLKRYVNEYN
jgi:radical SAM protein with 4Fe4S-binding SPASM domain